MYLAQNAASLGVDRVELGGARVVKTATGTVVRLQQRIGGVPVLGGAVIVRVGEGGEVADVAVSARQDLVVDTTPDLTAEEAASELESSLQRSLPAAERAELVISTVADGTLLWQLDVRDSAGGTRYFVDAHTGRMFGARDLAVDAFGRVYTENSVSTPTPADVELFTLDTVADPIRLNGWGGLLAVTNYVSGGQPNYTVEQTLAPTSGADFLYDPPAMATDPTDGFAQVNLFFHLTTMRDFFSSLGVVQTDPGWKITAIANVLENGQPMDNAFFSPMGQTSGPFTAPNLIAIGQGTQIDFAYDSDVFKHEFGHYVSDNAVGYNLGQTNVDSYGLSPFSGSIDEGIADYFACSNNDDSTLGEVALASQARELTDTSKVCPDDVLGEVHEDGEIIGSLSWSVREALGASAGDQVVWGAVSSMPPGGTIGDFARGLVTATQALVTSGTLQAADLMAVQGIIASRGADDCDQTIAIDSGETKKVQVIGLDLIGQLLGGSCSQAKQFGATMQSLFHFSKKPAAGDQALRFTVDATTFGGGGDVELTLYVRKGNHVTFKSGGFLPEVNQFDYSMPVNASTGEIIIDASSDPPFDPSAEYFFAVTSSSCPNLKITVGTSNEPLSVGTGGGTGSGGGGAGGGTDGRDAPADDGCGCATPSGDVGHGGFGVVAVVAALGAALGRRRRSR
jgi:MYXO-CTERM domain-containing protein